jgi:hypothetical protein
MNETACIVWNNYLVGKFSNPDGQLVGVVQLSGIGDESLSISPVEVESDGINLIAKKKNQECGYNYDGFRQTWQPEHSWKKLAIQSRPVWSLVQAGETR